jgi:hypothetical protein
MGAWAPVLQARAAPRDLQRPARARQIQSVLKLVDANLVMAVSGAGEIGHPRIHCADFRQARPSPGPRDMDPHATSANVVGQHR